MNIQQWQNKRVASFDELIKEMDNLKYHLMKAKNNTIDYYQTNPNSQDVVYPTDAINEYIVNIRGYLRHEHNKK
jgi:hypothetical protein